MSLTDSKQMANACPSHSNLALLLAILFLVQTFLCSTTAAPGQTSMSVEIPFRWTPGQIEILVSINGKEPIWCILDTGSEFTILDIEVSKTLGLAPTFRRYERDFVENITLSIGKITLRNQSAMLMPLDNFRRQNRVIRGVIGHSFFEHSAVTIDYKGRRLLVSAASSFQPDVDATVIPFTFVDRLPVIPVTLKIGNRDVTGRFMIDTGASQAAILRYPFTEAHGLFKLSERTTTEETVAAGPTGFVYLPVREIKIAHWRLSNPIVSAYAARSGSGGYTDTDGLIGNDVLRRFRVTFDYTGKRMLLKATEDLHTPFTLR